jgi:diphthamide synthase subunit DPH2
MIKTSMRMIPYPILTPEEFEKAAGDEHHERFLFDRNK